MSVSIIRSEILSVLQGLSATIGNNIYDYVRWSANWDDFLSYFREGSRVLGWQFRRESTNVSRGTTTIDYEIHLWRIFGYMSLDDSDATEKTFSDFVELIRDTFRPLKNLNGTAFQVSGINLDTFQNRMFGSTLCHYCEISFTTEEEKQWR